MESEPLKVQSYEKRSLARMVTGVLTLMILLGYATPPAMAGTSSLAVLNTCDTGYKALLQQTQIVKYAKTGKLPADLEPEHSRAFYMALLGMRDLLRSYLKKHHQALQYSDLLTAATYTDRKQLVVMLLEMGENLNRSGPDTSTLPLQIAADCVRPTIMAYLLSAGADVYGVSDDINAMASALSPSLIDGRVYVEDVRLLLSAGFDPRCPVTARGTTAIDIVRSWTGGKTWLAAKALIDTAARIVKARNPGKPHCGESGRRFQVRE